VRAPCRSAAETNLSHAFCLRLEPTEGESDCVDGHAKTDPRTVASLLRGCAQRTALRGGNPYCAKAYLRAADSLAALSQPPHYRGRHSHGHPWDW
jgi:hypothetical protein